MSNEELTALAALQAGDAAAERRLINACLPKLTSILRRRFPVLPSETITDAAVDALLELMQHPDDYDPQLGSLTNYLVHIGNYKLLDALRKLNRRREKYVGGNVELALVEANQFREADYPEPELYDPDTLPPDVQTFLNELLPDQADRKAFALLQKGRTSVAQFAAVWKLDTLPPESQATLVKQNRDRILKRVQRKKQEFWRLLHGEI